MAVNFRLYSNYLRKNIRLFNINGLKYIRKDNYIVSNTTYVLRIKQLTGWSYETQEYGELNSF